jgi:pimeloyl-ACP methyl ester carboxylesterase
MPCLVIHGAEDSLVNVSGGRATAAAIPDAELLVVDGMGHDLPRAVWPQVIDRMTALFARAS